MVKLIKAKYAIITCLITVFFLSTAFINTTEETQSGVFSCVINDKPYIIEGMHATLRKITDGQRQLSFSNDRFVKFIFLNPAVRKIDLSTATIRDACIRYEDPATNSLCRPSRGFVNIANIDESNKVVSGEFEMELVMNVNGVMKTIKVTHGKMMNIPLHIY